MITYPKNIIVAVTGASGAIYAQQLLSELHKLTGQYEKVAVIFSENAKDIWQHEIGNETWKDYPFGLFDNKDFNAPFASGSCNFDTMIICPASMGVVGRIASGTSDDLTSRAADVMLKEKRKLIVVPRETPFNLIHLRNMTTITEAGGIICPAIPSFYSNPATIEELTKTVISRVLTLAGFDIKQFRWRE